MNSSVMQAAIEACLTMPECELGNSVALKIVRHFFDTSPVTEDRMRELGFVQVTESIWQLSRSNGGQRLMEYSTKGSSLVFCDDNGYTAALTIHSIGQLRRLVSSLTQGE